MPYYPPDGEVLRVTYVMQLALQAGLNNMHFRVSDSTGLGASLTEIATALGDAAEEEYADCITSEAQFRGTLVHAFQATPQPAPGRYSNVINGTQGLTPLPTQVAGILSFVTDYAGPGGRGRIFIPFPDEAQNNAARQPSAGWIANVTLLAIELTAPLLVVGAGGSCYVNPGIWHVPEDGFPTFRPITGYIVRTRWGTQRRRGDYGQTNLPPV